MVILYFYTIIIFFAEKENAAASGLPSPSLDGGGKAGRMSESGRGGRKKYLSGLYMLICR